MLQSVDKNCANVFNSMQIRLYDHLEDESTIDTKQVETGASYSLVRRLEVDTFFMKISLLILQSM